MALILGIVIALLVLGLLFKLLKLALIVAAVVLIAGFVTGKLKQKQIK